MYREMLQSIAQQFDGEMERKDWNPRLHPRDPHTGQFIEKIRAFSVGIGLPEDFDPDSIPELTLAGARRRMRPGDPRKVDPDYHRATAHIESMLEENLRAGSDTESIHDKIGGVPGKYRAEREAVHLEIVDDFVNAEGVKSDKRMLFLGGLPGSGKTTWLNSDQARSLGVDLNEFVEVNPDEVKEAMQQRDLIPDYPGLSPDDAATLYHEESTHIAKMVAAAAVESGKNVVFDTSLSKASQWERAYQSTKDKGYDSTLVFIDVPPILSMQRAAHRHKSPGRFLPFDIIENMTDPQFGSVNRRRFEQVKDQADRWVHVDNAVEGGRIVKSKGIDA